MIFAVMMVRNEADIIRINLLHHLASGIDHVLVVDNGSTDGTAAVLKEFSDTKRVHVFPRPGAFHQAETTTEFCTPSSASRIWEAKKSARPTG